MKKIILLVVSTLLALSVAAKPEEQAIEVNQLPSRAQEFVSIYFGEAPVKKAIKLTGEGIAVEAYQVVLTNKVQIEFDMVGLWNKIDAKKKKNLMPRFIYPDKINETLDKNFADKIIKKVENDGFYYSFDFANGDDVIINALGQIMESEK